MPLQWRARVACNNSLLSSDSIDRLQPAGPFCPAKVALPQIGGPASAGVADQNQNPKSRGHMHALEIHGALLFVRLFSGNCLGFGYHDNQGIYEELCATYWDCKRL